MNILHQMWLYLMHRDASDTTTFDVERQYDLSGSPILKK